MSAGNFPIELLKVALDVPMLHRLTADQEKLVIVTTPIHARLNGKTLSTSEGKRIPNDALMKVKTLAVGMLPDYYVVCRPEELDQAVALIHEAVAKFIKKQVSYYAIVAKAVEQPLQVKTREEFMEGLMTEQRKPRAPEVT